MGVETSSGALATLFLHLKLGHEALQKQKSSSLITFLMVRANNLLETFPSGSNGEASEKLPSLSAPTRLPNSLPIARVTNREKTERLLTSPPNTTRPKKLSFQSQQPSTSFQTAIQQRE